MLIRDPEQRVPSDLDAAGQAHLFEPYSLRDITMRNRIVVSPMCQYSSTDGYASDWHLVHLGSRAVGGAGLVSVEATAVTADGRISPWDMGLWKDEHVPALARIASFVRDHGAVPGIQLSHAGRKASTRRPWEGRGEVPPAEGGWIPVAPSPVRFAPNYPMPRTLEKAEIGRIVDAFQSAAARALRAGFEVIEIHAAHGYLIHEFLSPLSNHRSDEYGGSFESRILFLREVVQGVRLVWPEKLPLFVRLSCTDWVDGGWTCEDSVALAGVLHTDGVDLIDCSSGGSVPDAGIPLGPGYQTPFAARIRREAQMPTMAVGLITEPAQADAVIRDGEADLVALARAELRDPYWPLHAAKALKRDVIWPRQYERARD